MALALGHPTTVHAAQQPGDVFAGDSGRCDHYYVRGLVLSLRQDAANGSNAPQLGLDPTYPRSLPRWQAIRGRCPDHAQVFASCAELLVQATDIIRDIAPNMRPKIHNLGTLNAGVARASALIGRADVCIREADRPTSRPPPPKPEVFAGNGSDGRSPQGGEVFAGNGSGGNRSGGDVFGGGDGATQGIPTVSPSGCPWPPDIDPARQDPRIPLVARINGAEAAFRQRVDLCQQQRGSLVPGGCPSVCYRESRAGSPRKAPQAGRWVPVFHYYYINGINTPRDGVGRGSYRWDFRMIRANLLDLDPKPVGFDQRPRQPASLKVDPAEKNLFDVETYNISGTQPLFVREGWCNDGGASKGPVVQALCAAHAFRASAAGGMAPGDLVECVFQSSLDMVSFASTEIEPIQWAGMIRRIYENEPPGEKHFFVLIAHSQGNFFAEGVASRLATGMEGDPGRFVFRNRLAVVSLGSPTSYESLPRDFVQDRLRHFTRTDDGINTLHGLDTGLLTKRPWPMKDALPQLWPWNAEMLQMKLVPARLCLQGITQIYCSPMLEALGHQPMSLCTPEGNPICNHALYTPLMNSHLLDNYLTDPTLTMPGKPVSPRVLEYLPGLKAEPPFVPPPVLTAVRTGLLELKSTLYRMAGSER